MLLARFEKGSAAAASAEIASSNVTEKTRARIGSGLLRKTVAVAGGYAIALAKPRPGRLTEH
jgi:hypothetical protein